MKRRVLVIDDEVNIAEGLAMVLAEHGYEVRAEYSGETGIQQAGSFQPDLVIVDVMMPSLNGVEAAILIQQQLPNCKILLFSAVPEFACHLLDELKNSPKFEVVAKPIDPFALLSILSSKLPS
jgi:CheY-like chemotaxis protein